MATEKEITSSTTILPGPVELAKETWEIYKARFWTIVGIGFLGYVGIILIFLAVLILGAIAFFALGGKVQAATVTIESILGIILLVGMVGVGTWISGSIIIGIDGWKKKIGIKESYQLAKPFILPLFLTSLLSGVLIFGSLFVLILPAIILGIWFSFAQYVVILDRKSGLLALHTSREYIRGHSWAVIGRLIAIHLPEIILTILIGSSGGHGRGGELSGLFRLVSLLAIPFYQMYSYTLFMHLRKMNKNVSEPVSGANKLLYLLIPVIGYLLILGGVIAALPFINQSMNTVAATLNGSNSEGAIGDGTKPGTQIVAGLIAYDALYKEYPANLNILVMKRLLPAIPNDATNGMPYAYELTAKGQDFSLCTPTSPKKCVTSKSSNFDF